MNKANRIYIHVPFCKKKCSYCAFHSVTVSEALVSKYFNKLKQTINQYKNLTGPLDSIFIGGGTPSILSPKKLEELFSILRDNFLIKDSAEISIENNPDSLTIEKIKLISSFANRISVGVQSFNKKYRSIIGRDSNLSNINSVINSFLDNNITNLSIDLIYGIPTQTLKDWEHELELALKMPFKHLSAYSLTYEEGTKLYSQIENLNSEDSDKTSAEMWQLTSEILNKGNISRYEVSNYSIPGYECNHNLDTWYGGKYIGFGPTAASYDGQKRWIQRKLYEWLDNEKPELDVLNLYNRTVEIFITGLRTAQGWKVYCPANESKVILDSIFHHKLSFEKSEWNRIFNSLALLSNINLVKINKSNQHEMFISATDKGLLFWDEIALELLE